MDTNISPLLADIFLYLYEAEIIQTSLYACKNSKQLSSISHVDTSMTYIHNPDFTNDTCQMYPTELEIKKRVEE